MNNIDIPGYNIEHTPTKSDESGALLYIPKELNYKNRNDLKLYKGKNLESVFIEVLSKFGKSTIIGYNQIWQYKSFFSYENKMLHFWVTLILTCHIMNCPFKEENS